MDARQERAKEILASGLISQQDHLFFVPSQSSIRRHSVYLDPEPSCDCDDFELRQKPCKHIQAVQMLLELQAKGEPLPERPETPPKPIRKTYSQDWPNYNAAQVAEKDHFQHLLADLCRTIPEPPTKQGRGRKPLPIADSLFSAIYKVYSTFSARRFMCDLEEAHRRGHISHLPHFNGVLLGLDNPASTPILFNMIRQSALPLRVVDTCFAVDSTGFTSSRFIRWYDIKYGTVKQAQQWVKVHLICGVKTNVVTAAEILGQHTGDSPQLPGLVQATAKGFTIDEVSADKAYTGGENFDAVAAVGGTLYAAFRANATGGVGGIYERMFHLFSLNREEYLQHYHKRSNVESTISMIKRKFGDSLRSKSDTAMVNESLAKVVCHNICCLISAWYELGIEPGLIPQPADDQPRHVLRFPG
jgi:transposase